MKHLLLLLAMPLLAAEIKRIDGSELGANEADRIVMAAMERAKVAGLGVAILNGNEVVYQRAFGVKNLETKAALTPETVMYGASFTKAAFAYMTMQLVDEKKIDLDRPLIKAYPNFEDVAADPRYRKITPRMLLSHTAGFPNLRQFNEDGKIKIYFEPGSRYAYSGEGLLLLQRVVEEAAGKGLGTLMDERVFAPLGMTRTSMIWRDDLAADVAMGHDEAGKVLGHRRRSKANAAGSMDTTLADYARFLRAVMRGEGLSKWAKSEMTKVQSRIRSRAQFPTLPENNTTANDAIQLSYGLGWGVFSTPKGRAYFKEGHDDGWENHSVVFGDKKTGIVLMSNSSNGDSIFMELLEALIGDRYTPAAWEGYALAVPR